MDDRTALVALRLMIKDLYDAGAIGDCHNCPLQECDIRLTIEEGADGTGFCGRATVEEQYMFEAEALLCRRVWPRPVPGKTGDDPRWD